MVYACSTHHQTGDTDSFQLVIPLTVQLDSQGTFVPCEARIVWYSAGRTSSRQLRDTTRIPRSTFCLYTEHLSSILEGNFWHFPPLPAVCGGSYGASGSRLRTS